MGRLTVDTSQAQSFELVEPGPYHMIVREISDPEKGDKSTYVTVTLEFEDPNLARHHGSIFRNLPIDGKGAGFFREFWKAATGEDIPMDATIDVDPDDAISARLLVNVGHNEYEGRTRNDAKSFSPVS